jgi:hypothetical protein
VLVCVAGLAGRAATRLLWPDELFTLYVSRLPDVAWIWNALASGVDLNPPLSYLATRVALFFGDGLVAVRVPSLAGFAVAAAGVFAIAARPCGVLAGWLAAILFVSTQAASYAYEARPYGLLLGLTALAFASWQRAPGHTAWIVALAASLAAAVSTHYFAVLIFVPLGAGEVVRAWERRRLDPRVWAAFAAGAGLLVAWLPLIRAAREFSGQFWARPGLDAMIDGCLWLAGGIALPLLVFMGTAGATLAVLGSDGWFAKAGAILRVNPDAPAPQDESLADAGASRAEWAAILTLSALPAFALGLGILVTGSFVARYTLPALIGWCVLLSWLACEGARTRSSRLALAIGILAAGTWAIATHVLAARQVGASSPAFASASSPLRSLPATPNPVVITDVRVYLPLVEYAPPSLRDRLVYPGKPERALAISRGNTGNEALQRLRQFVPLASEPLDILIGRREPLLIYGPPTWVGTMLLESGASLRLLAQHDDGQLLLQASWTARPPVSGRRPEP